MPRVSGIYSRPTGIDAVANNTIDSGKYNSNVADVEADLNLPRPVVAGGTGATDAAGSRDNLDAERSTQQVTNYNTHVFEAGSFFSNPGTTGEPVAGKYVSGVCHFINNAGGSVVSGSAVLDASVYEMDANPALATFVARYRRVKWVTWQPWFKFDYVNTAGDTMTGDLTISYATPALRLNSIGTICNNFIYGQRNGVARWRVAVGDASPESTGNAGSQFSVDAFDDTGAFIASPITIRRTDLRVSIAGPTVISSDLAVYRAATPTTSTVYFNQALTKSIAFDGTNFAINAPVNLTGSFFASTAMSCAGAGPGSTPGYSNTNTGFSVTGGGTAFHSSAAPSCATFNINADGANVVWLRSGVQVGAVNVTTTTTSYATTSDETLKEDLRDFTASGDLIDAIKVYDFRWKSTQERDVGVIAQKVVEQFPHAVSKIPTTLDGTEFVLGVDYSKFVPLLLEETKRLRKRVMDLETVVGTFGTILQRLDVLDKFREKIEAL